MLGVFRFFLLRRVQVALLVFFGLTTNYMLRVNLNMAIEYMVQNSSMGPHVDWTNDQQEDIKGAFFIGYLVLQIPGGRLAEMFGTKRVFGYAMILCTVLAAITPICSTLKPSVSFPLVYGIRVMQGLLEAVCFPAMNPLTSKWVPLEEKSKFVSFSYLGGTFGSVVTFPLAGLIIQYMSWVWVFYISSITTLVWFILWMVFFHDLPEEDPFISEQERTYILETRSFDPKQLEEDKKIPLIPLVCDILMTPAVWVDMMGDFCNGFGLYVLLSEGPAFFKNVYGFGPQVVGWICSAPQMSRVVCGMLVGVLSDWIIKTNRLSRLNMQKLNTTLAFLLAPAGMLVLVFLTSEKWQWVGIAGMIFLFGFNGCTMSGYIQNILVLGPNRSGTLYGVTNGFGNLSGYLVPVIKKKLVADDTDVKSWRWLFIIAASLYVGEALYFVLASSGKAQSFNSKSYSGVTTFSYFRDGAGNLFKCKTREDEEKNKEVENP